MGGVALPHYIGKRSADADAYYGYPYAYGAYPYAYVYAAAVPFGSSTGLDPITQGLDAVTQGVALPHYIGKRSADADADAYYGYPYAYGAYPYAYRSCLWSLSLCLWICLRQVSQKYSTFFECYCSLAENSVPFCLPVQQIV